MVPCHLTDYAICQCSKGKIRQSKAITMYLGIVGTYLSKLGAKSCPLFALSAIFISFYTMEYRARENTSFVCHELC